MLKGQDLFAVEVFVVGDMPDLIDRAVSGDREALRSMRILEKVIKERPRDQLCMFCDHEFTHGNDVGAWVLLMPVLKAVKPKRGKRKMQHVLTSAACYDCLDEYQERLVERIVAKYKETLMPDLIIAVPHAPGHA